MILISSDKMRLSEKLMFCFSFIILHSVCNHKQHELPE